MIDIKITFLTTCKDDVQFWQDYKEIEEWLIDLYEIRPSFSLNVEELREKNNFLFYPGFVLPEKYMVYLDRIFFFRTPENVTLENVIARNHPKNAMYTYPRFFGRRCVASKIGLEHLVASASKNCYIWDDSYDNLIDILIPYLLAYKNMFLSNI